MRARHAIATIGIAAAALGSLTACGSTQGDASTGAGTSAAAGGHLDEAGLMKALTVGSLKAGSAHVQMRLSGAATLSAEGDLSYKNSDPAMRMTASVAQLGSGRIELRLVHGVAYVRIPQGTPTGKFLKIDPADPKNPMGRSLGHLPQQMDPMTGFRAMRAGVRSVRYVGHGTVQGTTTDHYVVTVRSAPLLKAMKQKAVPGVPATLTYDVWLDKSDLLRRMRFAVAGERTDLTMSKWGEPVTVQAPPASQVVSGPGMAG
jgi:hypothetical protein